MRPILRIRISMLYCVIHIIYNFWHYHLRIIMGDGFKIYSFYLRSEDILFVLIFLFALIIKNLTVSRISLIFWLLSISPAVLGLILPFHPGRFARFIFPVFLLPCCFMFLGLIALETWRRNKLNHVERPCEA